MVQHLLTGLYLEQKITIGTDLATYDFDIDENTSVILQIWDFAGEREFRVILPSCVVNAAGGIFMYDITRFSTIKNLHEWINIFKENNDEPENITILLVGGKLDLKNRRSVPLQEGFKLAKDLNLFDYIECSSKSGKNIDKIFTILT